MGDDRVKFVCKRTVVSTKPVEPGKSYRFSVFDHAMEPNHIRLVYYYQCLRTRKPGETTKKLRESLAETATCFPMITGRLVKDEGGNGKRWKVKCNDAGVRMVEARATGTVEEWLRSVDREEELKLVHWEDMYHAPHTYFWSTFYVQVTEFEGGGFAIGLSCSHLMTDPICATMFVRAWAEITLAQTMMAPPLVHPLPARRAGNANANHKPHHNHLLKHYINSCVQTSLSHAAVSNVATVALLFTDPMVRAAARANGNSDGPEVSPFEVLAGLLWACVSRAKGMRDELMGMSLCLDVRMVLHIDQTYFGNCMVYHKVHYTKAPWGTSKDKLSHCIEEIRKTVKKLDYDSVIDLIEWMKNKDRINHISNGSDLVCTNLEKMIDLRYMMFEEDLIMSRVSCYVEGPVAGGGQIMVLPSPSGEGPMSRVVMVTLSRREMAKVLDDELLQIFSPIVLMGTRCK